MTTILLTIILIRLTGASALWAALIIPVAALYEFARAALLLDCQRKATEAALKADEARTFALGAALEARRIAEAVAPAPAVDLAVTPETPEPLPVIEPDARPHNL
jgi:hypothetical protein